MANNSIKTDYGYDLLWASTANYQGKIIVFEKAGNKTPLHYHKEKEKHYFVNTGKFKLRYIDTSTGQIYDQEMSEGSVFHAPPLIPCSLEALVDNSSVSEVNNNAGSDTHIVIPAKPINPENKSAE